MAADTTAVLEALGLERTHAVGYSMGGAVGLLVAVDRPDLVDRLVYFGGVSFDPSGVYPQLTAMFESSFDPHQLDGTLWHEAYLRVAPEPDAWIPLVEKVNVLDRAGFTVLPERLKELQVPTLLMIGDADVVLPEHVVALFRLIRGGVPGDVVPVPAVQLAILPGTNHVDLLHRVERVSSMIVAFLTPLPKT
ncbi:MAG TPA: alpha/beta hydrolase [Acidimicrobiales bacterium]|nr:alpha/beta hydrolase [Acidimicrobiales bacterium]